MKPVILGRLASLVPEATQRRFASRITRAKCSQCGRAVLLTADALREAQAAFPNDVVEVHCESCAFNLLAVGDVAELRVTPAAQQMYEDVQREDAQKN